MNTSQTSMLSKPVGEDRIPLGSLGYFRARNRHRIYDVVISEFQKSGISKASLARRLGKAPEIITRLLGAPGNWTLDTVSDLMFAISGAELEYTANCPIDQSPRNYNHPDWIMASTPVGAQTTASTITFSRSSSSFAPVLK